MTIFSPASGGAPHGAAGPGQVLAGTEPSRPTWTFRQILESSVVLSAAGLVTGLGNYIFQGIIGRHLPRAEYGYVNSTLGFIALLGLPLAMATTTITHYIARFDAADDGARVQGLLVGCRRFLFHLTLAGSVLAVVLIKPLSDFFRFPRPSLMLVALVCVLGGLWGSFATALCQGLAWFKRLALISLLAMTLRLSFGVLVTLKFAVAEMAVLASGVALLANLLVLLWRKELARKGTPCWPWDREFARFFMVSAACIGGGYCFTQGDLLVAQRYFAGTDLGTYTAAALLARALPMVVAPVLTVLFTHRSGRQNPGALREQLKLLGLYGGGLATGALGLLALRDYWVRLIFGQAAPEAAAMIGQLALTMSCVGLLQALALWALASRWLKLGALYGALGLAYWLTLLSFGTSPATLLRLMPAAAGLALLILGTGWILTMRAGRPMPAKAGYASVPPGG